RTGAVGHLRAHRGCRRAQRGCHPGATASDALYRDHSTCQADRGKTCARARDHRAVQRLVPRPAQCGEGHRVQPGRLAKLSLGPVVDKYWFADEARILANELQLPIYATRGTAEMLAEIGVPCTAVEKNSGAGVSGLDLIDQGHVDLVINVAREYDRYGRPD